MSGIVSLTLFDFVDELVDRVSSDAEAFVSVDRAIAMARDDRDKVLAFVQNLFAQFFGKVLSFEMSNMQGLYATLVQQRSVSTHSAATKHLIERSIKITYSWPDIMGAGYVVSPKHFRSLLTKMLPEMLQAMEGYATEHGHPELAARIGRSLEPYVSLFHE